MTSTSTHYLFTPLLRKLPRLEHERDYYQNAEYDEEVCMRGSQEESHDEKSRDESQTAWWFANCVLAIAVSICNGTSNQAE
jgi:hypothetical protein